MASVSYVPGVSRQEMSSRSGHVSHSGRLHIAHPAQSQIATYQVRSDYFQHARDVCLQFVYGTYFTMPNRSYMIAILLL